MEKLVAVKLESGSAPVSAPSGIGRTHSNEAFVFSCYLEICKFNFLEKLNKKENLLVFRFKTKTKNSKVNKFLDTKPSFNFIL